MCIYNKSPSDADVGPDTTHQEKAEPSLMDNLLYAKHWVSIL